MPPLFGYLQSGETPLYTAADKDKAEVAKVLIAAGATLTAKIKVRPSRHSHFKSLWNMHPAMTNHMAMTNHAHDGYMVYFMPS